MPKATLEFNLPEEQDEFNTACRAGDYKAALFEFDQKLRSKCKYGDGTPPQSWEEVRELLHSTTAGYDLEY